MGFELISFTSGAIQKQAADEIVKCNGFTARYGLSLTPAQAAELVETRAASLRDNGRIEFGGGAIDKIIREFCDSPYITGYNYAETLHELTQIFYDYKNETLDLIADDDLIKFMKSSFDGTCHGSLELLSGRELYQMAKNLRFGLPADAAEDDLFDGEEDEDE